MTFITSAHDFVVVLGGLTLLGLFVVMGVYVYWGYTRMDSIMEGVKECSLINRYRFYLQMGPWGRMMMVGGVASCLLFSKYLIGRGLLNAQDIDDFPGSLKVSMIVSQYVGWGLLVSLFVEYAVLKIIKC